jgi:cobalt-zinc-cadmium efflux system membrane fusion protein
MGVEGAFQVGAQAAPLAVRTKAIQRFRDFQVVFVKVGNTYEVRMLELGRQTPEWTEVLSGLKPGSEYVTDGAFLIRADIEKSGASHDH